ncbi:hypothetical protein WR25_10921 [Diploscapter pachys]|uniref:Protein bicaudal D n=1 Tax=Diploscapter pachys TaxID=2018661 RepID=A0A2A2K7V2_9BILA|nr:hypothetical protein WR25_10921 [Diploscapter pachys]
MGMLLLEQKETLEKQLADVQSQYDAAKADIELANKTLNEFRSQHQAVTRSELENEATLLEESSEKERTLLAKISQLENELRTTKQELDRLKHELERIESEHKTLKDAVNQLEDERRKLKEDLKDTKDREQRLQVECGELEEDNMTLQKNVANLRSVQVDFESLRIDLNTKDEEIEDLKAQVEESQTLRIIAERQVDEALQTAQQEREQRMALKKELEALKNAEHLSSLADMLNRMGEDSEVASRAAGNDLFSELQDSSDEAKVRELEAAKDSLAEEVHAREKMLIDFVHSLQSKLNLAQNQELDYLHARQQKDVILEKLDQLAKAEPTDKKGQANKTDLRNLLMLAGEKNAQLHAAQDSLIQICDQLYQFYHQMAQNQGAPVEKNVIEIVKKLRQLAKDNAADLPKVSLLDEGLESGTETDGANARAIPLSSHRVVIPPSFIKEAEQRLPGLKVADVLSESDMRQRVLQEDGAIAETSESLKKLLSAVKRCTEQAFNTAVTANGAENDEILMQNMKLRSLLSTKRDQISTLRTVLKSNKLTAESALASLREKYESEKKAMHDLAEKMRKELKQLKEDAATFASHRAMFTARCEELKAQVEELQSDLKANEEEKKTLNQLLRMAIQQKLNLTQRLEDVEVDRDRQAFKRGKPSGPQPGGGRGDLYQPPKSVRYPGPGQGPGNGPRGGAHVQRRDVN